MKRNTGTILDRLRGRVAQTAAALAGVAILTPALGGAFNPRAANAGVSGPTFAFGGSDFNSGINAFETDEDTDFNAFYSASFTSTATENSVTFSVPNFECLNCTPEEYDAIAGTITVNASAGSDGIVGQLNLLPKADFNAETTIPVHLSEVAGGTEVNSADFSMDVDIEDIGDTPDVVVLPTSTVEGTDTDMNIGAASTPTENVTMTLTTTNTAAQFTNGTEAPAGTWSFGPGVIPNLSGTTPADTYNFDVEVTSTEAAPGPGDNPANDSATTNTTAEATVDPAGLPGCPGTSAPANVNASQANVVFTEKPDKNTAKYAMKVFDGLDLGSHTAADIVGFDACTYDESDSLIASAEVDLTANPGAVKITGNGTGLVYSDKMGTQDNVIKIVFKGKAAKVIQKGPGANIVPAQQGTESYLNNGSTSTRLCAHFEDGSSMIIGAERLNAKKDERADGKGKYKADCNDKKVICNPSL